MKKILSLGLALFIFAAATQAQTTDTTVAPKHQKMHRQGKAMRGQRAEMAKKLNLTADQQTKLKALNDSFKQERQGIKDNANLSDDQKKQAYKDLFKKNREARQAIYTPEQKAIIEQSMKERRANHPGGRRSMPKDAAGQ